MSASTGGKKIMFRAFMQMLPSSRVTVRTASKQPARKRCYKYATVSASGLREPWFGSGPAPGAA